MRIHLLLLLLHAFKGCGVLALQHKAGQVLVCMDAGILQVQWRCKQACRCLLTLSATSEAAWLQSAMLQPWQG